MEAQEELSGEKMVENIETTGEVAPPAQEPQKEKIVFDGPDALLGHKLEYTANGKKVVEDIGTILKRASQGYNYAQLANGLKTREQEILEKAQQASQMEERWSRFENYARENPEWYQHWSQAWEHRDQVGNQPQTDEGEIEPRLAAMLEERLNPIQDFIRSQEAERAEAQIREQDQRLQAAIDSTRKEFPSIDFEASDPETGKTLEYQVLEFASQEGIRDFNKAFKVFYHDKLIASKLEEEKAKWAKEQETRAKYGFLGEPKLATKTSQNGPDYAKSSWDQVADFAAKKLGIN